MQHPLKKGDMQLVEAQKCVKPWVAIQRVQRNPQIDDQFTRPGLRSGKYTLQVQYTSYSVGVLSDLHLQNKYASVKLPSCKIFNSLSGPTQNLGF
jgi:hypothetical protein